MDTPSKKPRERFRKLRRKTSKKTEVIKTRAQEYVRGDDQEREESQPRITNETIAKEREEVLSGARRFIYPFS